MLIKIQTLQSIPRPERDAAIEQARSIFFETSGRTEFRDALEKAEFEKKYFNIFLENADLFFLARLPNGVAGYLAAAENTTGIHYALHPYLERFRPLISTRYPSHFHINVTGAARGLGTGSLLTAACDQALKNRGSPGVHIVTLATARNTVFYQRNGFVREAETVWNGKTLLLMGKPLLTR